MWTHLRLEYGFRSDPVLPHGFVPGECLPLVFEDHPVSRDALLPPYMSADLPHGTAGR